MQLSLLLTGATVSSPRIRGRREAAIVGLAAISFFAFVLNSFNQPAATIAPYSKGAAVEVNHHANETIIRQASLEAALHWDSLTIPAGHKLILEQTDPTARLRLLIEGDVQIAGTLDAGYQLDIDAGGAISIDNTAQITADSSIRFTSREGALEHAGHISVPGGQITLLSRQDIRILDGLLDVSGQHNGGRIRVGGGAKGGEGLIQAQSTQISEHAVLRADAQLDGNGGDIVVYARNQTNFHGIATARGGAQAGNGGHIEVSAAKVDHSGSLVETLAPAGIGGRFLLDPTNYSIGAAASDANAITYADLETALNANPGGVTIATSGANNGDPGNIIFVSAGSVNLTAPAILTLSAIADVNFANAFTATGSALTINAFADDFGAVDSEGDVIVDAGIITNGGDFEARGISFSSTAPINAGAGTVELAVDSLGTVGGTIMADAIDIDTAGDVLVNTDDGTNTPTVFRVNTSNGDIVVNHNGAMALTNAVITACSPGAQPCDIAIATHSPLTLAGNVLNMGGGDIALAAGADGFFTTGDDLTTAGHDIVASGGSGTISLFAGEDVLLTGDSIVSTETTGSILISAGTNAEVVGMSTVLSTSTATEDSPEGSLNGNVIMASDAVVRSADGDITIQAPRNLGIATVDADFGDAGPAGAVTLIADHAGVSGGLGLDDIGAITDTSVVETPNVEGGVVSLTAGNDGVGNGIGVSGAAGDFDIHARSSLSTNTDDSDQFIDTPFNLTLNSLNAGTANISLTTAATLAVDNSISGNSLDLRAIDTVLNGGASLQSGGGDIVLVSGMSFTNNAGAGVLSPGAGKKWLIKSTNNANTALGGLVPDETQLGNLDPDPALYTGSKILILDDQASVAPDSLTFMDQLVGTSSTGQLVTFSNPTNSSITLTLSIVGTHPGDFNIPNASDNCHGQSITSMGSCTFEVVFEPTMGDSRTAVINISVDNSYSVAISLAGTGVEYDLGDAPDGVGTAPLDTYPTLLANSGAAHVIDANAPFLGNLAPDSEPDGQPSTDAGATVTGDVDDGDGADSDDEDGVSFTDGIASGSSLSDAFTATNGSSTDGFVSAWLDINKDGVWDNATEKLANNLPIATGNSASFPAAAGGFTAPATAGNSYLRVRICDTVDQCNTPTGIAPNGEVEDVLVVIVDPEKPVITFTNLFTANGTADVGDRNVLMASIQAELSGTASTLKVSELTVKASGSGQDFADVKTVKLWRDDGDGVFNKNQDTVINSGKYSVNNGQLAFDLSGNPEIILPDTPQVYHVGYDFDISLAQLSLPMFAGTGLVLVSLIGFVGRQRRIALLAAVMIITFSAAGLTGCSDDEDDGQSGSNGSSGGGGGGSSGGGGSGGGSSDGPQTRTFRVTAAGASFELDPATEALQVIGLPVSGPVISVTD